jgi:hypothetical protein
MPSRAGGEDLAMDAGFRLTIEIGVAVFFVALICFEKHPHVEEINKRAWKFRMRFLGSSSPWA